MLQKEFEEQVNLRKFSEFSAIPPSEKKNASSIMWIVHWTLQRLVCIAMQKMSGSNSDWTNCCLSYLSRQGILGGTLIYRRKTDTIIPFDS